MPTTNQIIQHNWPINHPITKIPPKRRNMATKPCSTTNRNLHFKTNHSSPAIPKYHQYQSQWKTIREHDSWLWLSGHIRLRRRCDSWPLFVSANVDSASPQNPTTVMTPTSPGFTRRFVRVGSWRWQQPDATGHKQGRLGVSYTKLPMQLGWSLDPLPVCVFNC